eukprot:TRINITY_DN9293_c0_g1_i2.p1 TRINITY_DN9293_c0_g1~~TRINITY_DN9293_c0_g1_i2.p1  ORF type:complete len:3277 (-),score=789.67 TRINITY_DN9293_c0_g1_i2:178-10008(-)
MHPRVALFVASTAEESDMKPYVLRIASFPKPDVLLYIHVGLIRAGILDIEAARTLNQGVQIFNSYATKGTGSTPYLGMPEIRSVCILVKSLRRSRATQAEQQVDDWTLLCEAWLLAISTLLDSSTERELLWHSTVLSFGSRGPESSFVEHEAVFRQNLFNDTLVSQRSAKKDLNARFYDQIADTLKQKYSFFNQLIVQKCLATMQALVERRHSAIIGDAGAGKSDCIATVLEAGRNFHNDEGQPLFADVQVMRVNTLAHDTHQIVRVLTRAARDHDRALARLGANAGIASTRQSPESDAASKPPTPVPTSASDSPPAVGSQSAKQGSASRVWVVLDGPIDPVLNAVASSLTPLHMLDADPTLVSPMELRVIVETDQLQTASPAFASALAITFIDTQRGPSWKDRAVAWSHQLALSCPEYASLMVTIRELLVQLMDSILAFVLYYFHAGTRDESGMEKSADDSSLLDYRHQTTSFLSFFTSLLMDPVIEGQLLKASEQEALEKGTIERYVRLLIGMSSISSFGSSLLTHQRPRFEKYIRQRVLDPVHAEALPPLYDLYFDSKTGTFQAVTEIVRLTEPIVDEHNICVATEEFVAFQLRLRRLIAIDAPVMLAGTAGSGKSTLLRYLLGSPSAALVSVLYTTSKQSDVESLQAAVLRQLGMQKGGFLAPPNGKRFVLLIDDLHMSSSAHVGGPLIRNGQQEAAEGATKAKTAAADGSAALFGGYSPLAEWIRFVIEHRGFYSANDSMFVSMRDTSFLPSILSPDSQNLQACKRFSRHFFVVFLEIPSKDSIEKIFSQVLSTNLSGLPAEHFERELVSIITVLDRKKTTANWNSRSELLSLILDATLNVCKEAELASRQRLHGIARVFWDMSHTLALVPTKEMAALVEQAHKRRHLYSVVLKNCASHFGLTFGSTTAQASLDPDAHAVHLDTIAFSYFHPHREACSSRLLSLQQLELPSARRYLESALLRQPMEDDGFSSDDSASPRQTPGQTPGLGRKLSAGEDWEDLFPGDEQMSRKASFAESGVSRGSYRQGSMGSEESSKDQASPGPETAGYEDGLAAYREMLCSDEVASLMWLHDDAVLCTLLRLCHTMYLHPVVCIVGAWAHLPLLKLVSRLFGGEDIEMCTELSAEAIEQELLSSSRPSPAPQKGAPGGKDGGDSKHDRRSGGLGEGAAGDAGGEFPCKAAGDEKARAQRDAGAEFVGPRLRIVGIGEAEVPQGAFAKFLTRQRRRYYKPDFGQADGGEDRNGADHDEDDAADRPPSGHKLLRRQMTSLAQPGVQRHTCLAVLCRSPMSYHSLATRCAFVHNMLAATFVMPLQQSLVQVATAYLPMRLGNVVSNASLPKQERMIGLKRMPVAEAPVPQSSSNRLSVASVKLEMEKEFKKQLSIAELEPLFVPLAQATDGIHGVAYDCLSKEYGKEFAHEFCSPYRFSQFLQMVARLARQYCDSRKRAMFVHRRALATLERLRVLSGHLDGDLREVRVSLRLLVEEASRLTSRIAAVTAERQSAQDVLARLRQKKQTLTSRIAEVDARYGGDLSRAQGNVDAALRELLRLPSNHFEDLALFLHPPPSVFQTLEVMHTILAYLAQQSPEAADGQSAAGLAGGNDQDGLFGSVGDNLGSGGLFDDVSEQQLSSWSVASAPKSLTEQSKRCRAELEQYKLVVATKDILGPMRKWSSNTRLPPWLAPVMEAYVSDKACLPNHLRELNLAAGGLSAWLAARLQCHRVLEAMEAKRQSMGDLSHQMTVLVEELGAAEAEVARMEKDLKRLKETHTITVMSREEQTKLQHRLTEQVERVHYNMQAYTLRQRQFEIHLDEQSEDLHAPEQWGGILLLASASVYSAAFSPLMRKAIAKEVRVILTECAIPVSKYFNADAHYRSFLPAPFVQLAQSAWEDKYMFESVSLMEVSPCRCSIILDPFDQGLHWLQEMYGQSHPSQPEGWLAPHTGKTRRMPQDGNADEPEPGQRILTADSVSTWEGLQPSQDRAFRGGGITVVSSDKPPSVILAKLENCMKESEAMVIQLHSIVELRGFIGTLLLMLQSVESRLSLFTEAANVDLRLSPPRDDEAESALDIRLYGALQRLQHGMALPYRRFRLFVIVPQISWNMSIWCNRKKMRADLAMKMPAKLWSLCNIISLDTRPAHPVHAFLPIFGQAKDPDAAQEAAHRRKQLAMQSTRMQVVEEVLLYLLVNAVPTLLDGEVLHASAKRHHEAASKLCAEVAANWNIERQYSRRNQELHQAYAGTAAVLLCAKRSAEKLRNCNMGLGCFHLKDMDNFYGSKLNVNVSGLGMNTNTFRCLLLHQLRLAGNAAQGMSALLELLLRACGLRQAAVLRSCLLLEGIAVRDKKLSNLFEALVSTAVGPEELGEEGDLSGRPGQSGAAEAEESTGEGGAQEDGVQKQASEKSREGDAAPSGTDAPSSKSPEATAAKSEAGGEDDEDSAKAGSEQEASDGVSDEEEESEEEAEESEEGSVEESGESEGSGEGDDSSQDSKAMDKEKEDKDKGKDASFGVLATTGNRDVVNDLVKEFVERVDQCFPPQRPTQSLQLQLRRLPAELPLLIIHDMVPVLAGVALQLGMKVREESAISLQGGHRLAWHLEQLLMEEKTWVMFDLADVPNFSDFFPELAERLRQRFRIPLSASRSRFRAETECPSRLFMFSSSETKQVPRWVISQCFCIQNAVSLFGLREELVKQEGGAGRGASPQGVTLRTETPSDDGSSPEVILPTAEEASAENLEAALEDAMPFLKAVVGYLSYTHPLLTAHPLAMHDEGFKANILDIGHTLCTPGNGLSMLQDIAARCRKTERVVDWCERIIVKPALNWAERSAVKAMLLHGFAPALLRQNDRETRDTLRTLASKLCGMLQALAGAANSLMPESPFWLRMELNRTGKGLEAARRDLAGVYSALIGNVHWNSHLFAVYTAVCYGRAYWSDYRPLGPWMASLQEHVQFLSSWKSGFPEDRVFRIGSIADVASYFAPFVKDSEVYHLRLEKKEKEFVQPASSTKLPGLAGPKLDKAAMPRQASAAPEATGKDTARVRRISSVDPSDAAKARRHSVGTAEGVARIQSEVLGVADTRTRRASGGDQARSARRDTKENSLEKPTQFVRRSSGGSPRAQAGRDSSPRGSMNLDDMEPRGSSKRRLTREGSKMAFSMSDIGSLSLQAMRKETTTEVAAAAGVAVVDPAPSCMLVEGLRLMGASWRNQKISEASTAEYESELPAMLLRAVKGPPPKDLEWYACPLLVAHVDEHGADLTSPAVATVYVKTVVNPALCAVRAVRLVSFA